MQGGRVEREREEREDEMLFTEKSFIFNGLLPYPIAKTNGKEFRTTMAKRKDLSENPVTQPKNILPLRVSNPILVRSVVAVLGLGFIDAGYSGDWSRIGVISKETEDLLKLSAFIAFPVCIFLIFSFSRKQED